MVITILTGHVADDRVAHLTAAYEEAVSEQLSPDIVATFLGRDTANESRFQIVTVWASAEALHAMRASVDKPRGVLIFEAAGTTPELTVLDVVAHLRTG